jgi:hypothetical protein
VTVIEVVIVVWVQYAFIVPGFIHRSVVQGLLSLHSASDEQAIEAQVQSDLHTWPEGHLALLGDKPQV